MKNNFLRFYFNSIKNSNTREKKISHLENVYNTSVFKIRPCKRRESTIGDRAWIAVGRWNLESILYIYLKFNTLIHCPNMVIKLSMYVGPHDVYPTTDVNFAF